MGQNTALTQHIARIQYSQGIVLNQIAMSLARIETILTDQVDPDLADAIRQQTTKAEELKAALENQDEPVSA